MRIAFLLFFISTTAFAQKFTLGPHIYFENSKNQWVIDSVKSFVLDDFGKTFFINKKDSSLFLNFQTFYVTPEQLQKNIPDFNGSTEQLIELKRKKYDSKLKVLGTTSSIKAYKGFSYFQADIENDSIHYHEIFMMNIYEKSFHTYVSVYTKSKRLDLGSYVEEIIDELNFVKINAHDLEKTQSRSNELVLFAKIESGTYEPEQYLQALLFKQYNKDFSQYLKTARGNMKDVFGEGLIKSIIKKDYTGLYQIKTYFTWFKFKNNNGKTYFYQDCALTNEKHFFIWGEMNDPQNIEYHTSIVNDIENFITDEFFIEKELIINRGRNCTFIGMIDSDKPWQSIRNEFEGDSIYATVYSNCSFEADSTVKTTSMTSHRNEAFFEQYFKDVPKNKPISFHPTPENRVSYFKSAEYKQNSAYNDSLQVIRDSIWNEIKGSIPRSLRLYISDIIFEDLNNDGNLEFYWFAISNNTLIHLQAVSYVDGELIQVNDKSILDKIKQSSYFEQYKWMSIMEKSPEM